MYNKNLTEFIQDHDVIKECLNNLTIKLRLKKNKSYTVSVNII